MACHTVRVYVMRHVKTAMNQQRQYMGWTDAPIIEEVEPLQWLPEHVVSSDLQRCIQTAHGYFPQTLLIIEPRLRELCFGDFEGKTYQDLQHNATYRQWIDDPHKHTPPNGEPFMIFTRRVLTSFVEHVANETVFVVHGGVMRAILAEFAPQQQDFWQYEATHDHYYVLAWDNIEQVKEGRRCKYLSVVPIVAKQHTSNNS